MTTPTTPEALATEVDRHWLDGRDAIALGVAWAAVEAVLPEGWALTELAMHVKFGGQRAQWTAMAECLTGPGAVRVTWQPTPTEALTALHAALLAREEGSR